MPSPAIPQPHWTNFWRRAAKVLRGAPGWLLLAPLALYAQGNLPRWIFAGPGQGFTIISVLALAFYGGTAGLTWLGLCWLDPLLCRKAVHSLAARMALGVLLLASGMGLLAWLVYLRLFPLLVGRAVNPLGLYEIIYKSAMVAVLVYGWMLFARTTQGARAQASGVQEETDALATALHRTELALLEAQIEPHFLFNTLALIKRQYRVDAVAAAKVMHALLHYLEQAGPALREANWCLRQELDLVSHYLDILAYRFGPRLRYSINLPPECEAARIPALVLATLVENAVRHGLTPKAEGGSVLIEVRLTEVRLAEVRLTELDGNGPPAQRGAQTHGQNLGQNHAQNRGQNRWQVQVSVTDDGVGLRQGSGSGLGLSTVRARLQGVFGAAANLLVQPQQPSGVCASVVFPYRSGD
jgi:signal transduction histidine kinase